MPGIGAMSGKKKKAVAVPPPTQKREVEIIMEDLDDMAGGGYTLGFSGLPNTGKTTQAIGLGYLHLDFLPLYEDKFPLIAKALRDEEIPYVNKIVIIDSENALRKQMKRKFSRDLFKELTDHTPIKVIRIAPVAQDVMDSVADSMPITQESVSKVFFAIELYEAVLRQAFDEYDEHTLFILDSASRLYKLINAKAQIVYNRRVQDKGEETVKNEGFNKWGNRNIWWDQDMTLLRGVPGWVVATFQMKEKPDWVIESEKKKGKYKGAFKIVRSDDTAFNLDMDFVFSMDNDKLLSVDVEVGRYVERGEEAEELNHVDIDTHDRFSGLQIIENMLKVMEGQEFDD